MLFRSAPLTGQLWWNNSTNILSVYNGSTWGRVGGATSSSSAPSSPVAGDLWYDSTNAQLNVYSGTGWILVGPAYTPGTGKTGAIVETISDGTTSHVAIKFYVNDTIIAIMSKDATYSPSPSITGFASISPGMQMSTASASYLFRGTSTDSQLLDGIDSLGFLQRNTNQTTTGKIGRSHV